jgi:hypothetical protein
MPQPSFVPAVECIPSESRTDSQRGALRINNPDVVVFALTQRIYTNYSSIRFSVVSQFGLEAAALNLQGVAALVERRYSKLTYYPYFWPIYTVVNVHISPASSRH